MDLSSRFPGQKPDEKVHLVLHRHWFVLIKDFFTFVALATLPLIIFIIAQSVLAWELANNSLGFILLIMGSALYYLFLWNLAFGFWLDYILDYNVVTDQRVIDIEQSGLFNRTVAEQPLYRVQDVTTEVRGVFPTMLKYGTVYIQTAGEKQRFVFEEVPNPEDVAKLIVTLSEQHPQTQAERAIAKHVAETTSRTSQASPVAPNNESSKKI